MNFNSIMLATKKTFSKKTFSYWEIYLANQENFGHAERSLSDKNLLSHINNCLKSSHESILRIKLDTNNFKPKYILEIGSSVGVICLQAKKLYPESKVIGIEPEKEAIFTSNGMAKDFKLNNLFFVNGEGENLPFKDEQFDLIICHTVIEHVKNVALTLSEMRRVLSPKGIIHLEAPNYNWPYEPHLGIWCIPRLGKGFVKFLSKLQKKNLNITFLDHLQFVHPSAIERNFTKLNMSWDNLSMKKILNIMNGNNSSVKQYIKLSKILKFLDKLLLNKIILKIINISKVYPSIMYLIYKKNI